MHSLVVVVDKAPPLPQEGGAIGTPIYGRQAVFSAVRILPLQELHLDTDVATIDTAEVQRLRIDIEEIPSGGEEYEEVEEEEGEEGDNS